MWHSITKSNCEYLQNYKIKFRERHHCHSLFCCKCLTVIFLYLGKYITMRQLLLIATFLVANLINAQEGSPVAYTDVVKVSDSTKSAKLLHSTAKMWFTQTFKDPKEVIILDDSNNNIIVGRGNIRYLSKVFSGSAAREGWISFDVQIASKDGRYKYNFSNFLHEGHSYNYGLITTDKFLPVMKGLIMGGPEGYKIKVTEELRSTIKSKVELLISSLKETMEKPLSTKEDW